MLAFDYLTGLWSRPLLVLPDGQRDNTTSVYWLQGPDYYADLRQPEGRPVFVGVRCLRDLNHTQVAWIAKQECFAGKLSFDGVYFEWRRDVDFQPQSSAVDAGRLWFEGEVLMEEGRDIPYIEHWRREPCALRPTAAVRLQEAGSERMAFIVRVGDLFMTARGRPTALTGESNLSHITDRTNDLMAAQDLIDVEVSFGRVTDRGWRVERSSLPYKEGCVFEAALSGGQIVTGDADPEGRPIERRWHVKSSGGMIEDIFSAPGAEPRSPHIQDR